jgi:hypothetical protein
MTSRAPLAALLLVAATASIASAQRRPRPPAPTPPAPTRFTTTTAFSACTTSWAFACNIPTGRGGHYGTAHPMQHCTSYTFSPDGTVAIASDLPADHATYRIVAGKVMLSMPDADGGAITWDLPLSADGATLGGMKRVK